MANLLVITGNTALKAAWSDGTVLGKTFRYQGEKMLDYLLSLVEKEKPEVLTIASVCGILAEEEEILKRHCSHLIILDENHTSLLLKYNFPEYLPCDRAAGLVAARFSLRTRHAPYLISVLRLPLIFWELTEGILAVIFLLGAGPERKRWKDIQRIFL